MSKLLSVLIIAAFSTVSAGSFAASHGGAMKDGAKMEAKEHKKEMKEMKEEKKEMKEEMKEEKKEMMEEKKEMKKEMKKAK